MSIKALTVTPKELEAGPAERCFRASGHELDNVANLGNNRSKTVRRAKTESSSRKKSRGSVRAAAAEIDCEWCPINARALLSFATGSLDA